MVLKSDRLKKLENELNDLETWLKLGLVPTKEIKKHQAEIESIRAKLTEERERLQYLRESGDSQGYVTPRRQQQRTQYTELPTLPDIEVGEETATTEAATETEADSFFDTAPGEEATETEETKETVADEDDPFSDRNRWRRGMLHGDEDEW